MAPIVGYFGGKFMPMHQGHMHCLRQAASECDLVYLVLFVGGPQEQHIITEMHEEWLTPTARRRQIIRAAQRFKNVVPVIVDISSTVRPDGTEDWSLQTPLVREQLLLPVNYIYGSEMRYVPYYKANFPEAEIRLVDTERNTVPISATMLRNMTDKQREEWMV